MALHVHLSGGRAGKQVSHARPHSAPGVTSTGLTNSTHRYAQAFSNPPSILLLSHSSRSQERSIQHYTFLLLHSFLPSYTQENLPSKRHAHKTPPSSFHRCKYHFPSTALLVSVCSKLSLRFSIFLATKGVNCDVSRQSQIVSSPFRKNSPQNPPDPGKHTSALFRARR